MAVIWKVVLWFVCRCEALRPISLISPAAPIVDKATDSKEGSCRFASSVQLCYKTVRGCAGVHVKNKQLLVCNKCSDGGEPVHSQEEPVIFTHRDSRTQDFCHMIGPIGVFPQVAK